MMQKVFLFADAKANAPTNQMLEKGSPTEYQQTRILCQVSLTSA
jgi:hypothetical protein